MTPHSNIKARFEFLFPCFVVVEDFLLCLIVCMLSLLMLVSNSGVQQCPKFLQQLKGKRPSGYNKPLTTICWKTPVFQSKQPMTKQHVSLNRQFTVVLNRIICFSVQFCNNSLLVLKVCFQVFSFGSKKVQGFSSDRKILMSLLSAGVEITPRTQLAKFYLFSI